MQIEPLLYPDLDFLNELQPADWGDIIPPIKYYIDSSLCYPIKLTIDHKIVGIGTTIYHGDTAWLAHILVHPGFRNKGIGLTITKTLVESIDNRKYETIYLIATDLGLPVYLKAGFEKEIEYAHFKKERITSDYHISDLIIPFEEKYSAEIFTLDKYVSGENRKEKLKEQIQNSLLLIQGKKVEGAYFPTLGDGMIITNNAAAGIELMKLRIQTMDTAAVPVDNKAGINFLMENGFKQIKTYWRMRLGKQRNWHPTNLYNRISGQYG